MKGVRAVVLSGEGRSFCAGLDMQSMAGGGASASGGIGSLTDRTHGNANTFQQVALLWRKLPMPVIAAVHGVCFGGGLQIASGADIRVVAPDARLAVMEMKWGLIPDMGGYALWRGLVRDDVLARIDLHQPRVFGGGGVVSWALRPMSTKIRMPGRWRSRTRSPTATPKQCVRRKALFNEYTDMDEDAILMAESERQARVIRTPNQIEAVMAGMQKRAANFAD